MSRNDEIREQIRLMTSLCWRMLSVFGITLLLALLICWCYNGCTGSGGESDTLSVRVDSVRDTIIIEKHDTVPVVRRETVVRRIPVLELLSEAKVMGETTSEMTGEMTGETTGDSLDIVQREYSDDSAYTAWVSGIRYADYPRLDSITVRQREITSRITETITIQKNRSRWSVGLQAGYGYGFLHRGFEPYVGVGVTYSLFPP